MQFGGRHRVSWSFQDRPSAACSGSPGSGAPWIVAEPPDGFTHSGCNTVAAADLPGRGVIRTPAGRPTSPRHRSPATTRTAELFPGADRSSKEHDDSIAACYGEDTRPAG